MPSSKIGVGSSRWRPSLRKVLLMAALPVGVLGFANTGRADVISDVNAQLLNIIQNTSGALIDGPPNVAREIAMVDGAMFDAINAASGAPKQSLYYGGGAVANADVQAAALSAAYNTMQSLYGAGSLYATQAGQTISYNSLTLQVAPNATQYAAITAAVAAVGTQLSALTASTAVTNGTALGAAAATAMINGRATDGGTAAMLSTLTAPYVGPSTAGTYVTPSGRPPLEPTAGSVTPFVINQTQQNALVATVPAPPAVTSTAYFNTLLPTACQGSSGALTANLIVACKAAGLKPQTAAQAQAALYWNDPGGTYQPPGHLLQIADTVAAGTGLSLLQHAQEDALVGAAMSDAGAAAWTVKYAYNRWRPTTAIQDCSNWNTDFFTASGGSSACDPTWSSLIATPPHPDYLAGHPAFSGAAATVLDNFFGTDAVSFTVSSQAYCNGGTTTRDAAGNIIACTLAGITYTPGDPAHGCNNAGASDPINGVGSVLNPSGLIAPLNADYSVNTSYNNSPLICPISETFAGFQAAANGDLGSTFSRVAGGIHTVGAVDQAVILGIQIGQAVSNEANIPEPGTLALLTVSLLALGVMRHRDGARMFASVRR